LQFAVVAAEWLNAKGFGVFYLCYSVDKMEPEAYEASVVFEMLNRLTGAGKPATVHLDTCDILGYFMELADRTFVERLEAWLDLGLEPLTWPKMKAML
jgi:hypothetical protein